MHGVTTAIVAFIFAGLIWPHLVKNKVQFYAALLMVVFIILFDSLAHIFGGHEGFRKVAYAATGLLQIVAIVMLILGTGMSARELGGEVFNTIEVVRRGGEKETIIVPLTGEKPKPRNRDVGAPASATIRLDPARDIAAEEAALDAAERAAAEARSAGGDSAQPVPPGPVVRRSDGGSIPLE